MSQHTLEIRVASLKRKFAELEATIKNGTDDKAWQRTFGMFKGNETIERIDEEGRKWREAERRKARTRKSKTKQAKA